MTPTVKEIRATLFLRRDGAIRDDEYNPLSKHCRELGFLEDYIKNEKYKRRGITHTKLTLLGWETLARLNHELGYGDL